jgi:xylan 1,4-beta-xylosidase
MGIAAQLRSIQQGFKIIAEFPEWRDTPVILGESDPEGCAACSAQQHPENSYRNGPLYAAYTAEVLQHTLALARREHTNLLGTVTWAFEFEDQPYFAGFRELASNGLDKPVLNIFRMLGLLGDERLKVNAFQALPTEMVVRDGVRERPDINAIATRKQREIDLLVWNYHDDDLPANPAQIEVDLHSLPRNTALADHFRVDSNHSNAFSAWKAMGSPQSPSADQLEALRAAGHLQLLNSPVWISVREGMARLQFSLPRQGISLMRLSW